MDETLAAELGRLYGVVFRKLNRTYDDLERAIAAEVAKGRTPAVSWIVRLEQHKKLLADIEAEIYAYGKQATEIISNGQHNVLSVVNANQATLTVLSAGAAPEYALNVIREGFIGLNADALRHFVGRASDGSPLGDLFEDAVAVTSGIPLAAGSALSIRGTDEPVTTHRLVITSTSGTTVSIEAGGW